MLERCIKSLRTLLSHSHSFSRGPLHWSLATSNGTSAEITKSKLLNNEIRSSRAYTMYMYNVFEMYGIKVAKHM